MDKKPKKKERAKEYDKKFVIPENMTFDKMIALSVKPKDVKK